MRRLMPMWASLFAVLLLLQWGGAATPCLTALGGPAMVLCHIADQPTSPQPDGPAQHADMACPLCAPLPPALLPIPPVLHRPVAPGGLITVDHGPVHQSVASRLAPQQPRAPPTAQG